MRSRSVTALALTLGGLVLASCGTPQPQDLRLEAVINVDRSDIRLWQRLIREGFAIPQGLAFVFSTTDDLRAHPPKRPVPLGYANIHICGDSWLIGSGGVYNWPFRSTDVESSRNEFTVITSVSDSRRDVKQPGLVRSFDLRSNTEPVCLALPGDAFSFNASNQIKIDASTIRAALSGPLVRLPDMKQVDY